jgi:hypothetical protein
MKLELTNKNYCGTVVKIDRLIELDNCDSVQHANIFGNLVIVSKNIKEGDIGIYFPVECKLSDEFLKNNNLYRHNEKNINIEKKGYFEDNGRIKAAKFRGHISNGFFIELESLSFIEKDIENKLNIGDEFNNINGINICDKYVIRTNIPRERNGKKAVKAKRESRIVDGQFRFHYDTAQLGKNIHILKPDDIISITGKIHGTSAVVGNLLTKKRLNIFEKLLKYFGVNIVDTEYGMIYSSRKVIKNEYFDNRNGDGFYDCDVWLQTANNIYPYLKQGMTVYYEIVGYTENGQAIQKDYDYSCNIGENKTYIYRITYTGNDGNVYEFSAKQVQDWCKNNGFLAVPEYYYGYAKDLFKNIEKSETWNEDFLEALKEKYLEKDCVLCRNNVPDEGIVLRIENPNTEAFKLKSFRFLQKETKDLDQGVVSMEDEN